MRVCDKFASLNRGRIRGRLSFFDELNFCSQQSPSSHLRRVVCRRRTSLQERARASSGRWTSPRALQNKRLLRKDVPGEHRLRKCSSPPSLQATVRASSGQRRLRAEKMSSSQRFRPRRRCSSTRSCLTKSRRRKHRNGLASGTKYSPVKVLASSGCPLMRADLLRLRKARRRKHPNGLRSGKKSFPANFGCRRSCPRAPLRTFARVHEACGERSK